MHNCYKTVFGFLLGVIFLWPLAAQEKSLLEPISLSWQGDSLVCLISGEAVVNPAVSSTLLSGLPVLVDLRLSVSGDGKALFREQQRFRMSYDIWEDQYLLENNEGARFFKTQDTLSHFWRNFQWVKTAMKVPMSRVTTVEVVLEGRLTLLTAREGRQLRDWLFNVNETEESSPVRGRDTGFQLDLNSLISLLWGSRKDNERIQLVEGRALIPRKEIDGDG